MSEEKLYAVKNDEGKYFDCEYAEFLPLSESYCPVMVSEDNAKAIVHDYGGHVVTLVEEPKKVALTEEQAEIVERAHIHNDKFPATFISGSNEDEELLMNAYVNGYTGEKDKRYLVELDGLVTTDGAKQYLTKKDGKWFACRRMPGMRQDFTDEELNKAPEWAQQLDREEVTDDDE
ncbi:MAG: DUF1642 domain-containing protein [Lacticaseibacillus paracasei]